MTSGLEKPFRIEIPDERLELLRKKLELTALPDELEDAGRDCGVPLADIKRLLARWKDGYDWRKYEAQLNDELPQYTLELDVDGFGVFTVHYVHQKSTVAKAIPLLFVHGWPGSFIEVQKILPLLTQASPEHPSFHVVAVGLPGYAFSSAPTKKGFKLAQYAELFNKLMIAIGYNEYVTQGGDWGSVITREIALLYGGKHSKAWHTNMPLELDLSLKARLLAMIFRALWGTPATEKARTESRNLFRSKGSGYMAIQSTQPQTLGYGLADSPVGLLAWIYEKLVNWTDDYKWSDDEVLTWVSICWFSCSGPAASVRIYYEVLQEINPTNGRQAKHAYSTGIFLFPKRNQFGTAHKVGAVFIPKVYKLTPDINRPLKPSNLVFESQHSKGGHFAATEVPELLVSDLRKMFGKGGPAAGVVAGHGGYD